MPHKNQYSREPATGLWRGGIGCMGHFDDNSRLARFHLSKRRVGWFPEMAVASTPVRCQPAMAGLTWRSHKTTIACFCLRIRQKVTTNPCASPRKGTQGNPHGVGAQLSILQAGRKGALHEIYAGSGYLSQSTPRIYVQRPENGFAVEVRWAGWLTQRGMPFSKATENLITLAHPGLNLQLLRAQRPTPSGPFGVREL